MVVTYMGVKITVSRATSSKRKIGPVEVTMWSATASYRKGLLQKNVAGTGANAEDAQDNALQNAKDQIQETN